MTDHELAAFRALADGFKGRASTEDERFVGAPLEDRIAMAVDLLPYGERVIAFENLVANLYDYEVPISAEEYEQLVVIGRAWTVAPERWRFLTELVRP